MMVIFVITGTYSRIAEETLEFYELIITDILDAGYNALSAVALILLGAGIDCLGNKDTFDTALTSSPGPIPTRLSKIIRAC